MQEQSSRKSQKRSKNHKGMLFSFAYFADSWKTLHVAKILEPREQCYNA
jgi:hypothetical protein